MDIEIDKIGAIGDGVYLNTTIIQKAIDDCNATGGGRVVVSGGVYLTGKLILKSNVTLHVAAGAMLLGAEDYENYPETEHVKHVDSSKLPRLRNNCFIFADECENIAITGDGTIDCNGDKFIVPLEGEIKSWPYKRIDGPIPPRVVFFTGCKNVKVEDITMVNQPAGWSYWIHDCDFVTFDKVKIIANVEYPNNDGIHINCSRNVTISNSSIICGDDCIIVRANSVSLKENKVCEKVVVTNCNLTSYSSGIRIGWQNDGTIRNCTFSNIVMTDTTIGIGIVLPYGKPVNFDVVYPGLKGPVTTDYGREETLIENLSFNNIIMDKNFSGPVRIDISSNPLVACKAIRNIYFSNMHVRGPVLPFIRGRENCHVENVWFTDCNFEVTDGSEFGDCAGHGAYYARGQFNMYTQHVDNLRMNNTTISVV